MRTSRTSVFTHSCIMVKKTFNNYLLLSVTILLSFSIMLGYLIFTDSSQHTKYGGLMCASPNIIISGNINYGNDKLGSVVNQLETLPNTHFYFITYYNANTSYGYAANIHALPQYIWGFFDDNNNDLDKTAYYFTRNEINNQLQFTLGNDEAIVEEQVYRDMKKYPNNDMKIKMVFTDKQGKEHMKEYKIIGTYSNNKAYVTNTRYLSINKVYVSASSIDDIDMIDSEYSLVIYTENIDYVINLLKTSGLSVINCQESQQNAINEMRNMTKNKYIIATVLFLILGINLYSSFKNALNERKFEIGVKRAIGAGKLNIMLQFVIEGLMVMIGNILLSIYIIINAMLVYKFVLFEVYDKSFIIKLSTESLLLFILFSFSLSIIFSLLFAYQSTNVEIIKYLKEE